MVRLVYLAASRAVNLLGAIEGLFRNLSPSPFKERGIKGVRLINNLGDRGGKRSYELIPT
jgi:hypothetical protein